MMRGGKWLRSWWRHLGKVRFRFVGIVGLVKQSAIGIKFRIAGAGFVAKWRFTGLINW